MFLGSPPVNPVGADSGPSDRWRNPALRLVEVALSGQPARRRIGTFARRSARDRTKRARFGTKFRLIEISVPEDQNQWVLQLLRSQQIANKHYSWHTVCVSM